MSSTFSMTNQKLKEFFGANQTKNFGLESEKDSHQVIATKLTNFIKALKHYYEVILMWPVALEKLYMTFGQLAPKEATYDGAEYQSSYFSVVESSKVKVNNLYERYSYIQRQLGLEQEGLKKHEKEFEIARQRYDHYKTKIQKLTKEFSTMQNPKAYKTAKEQLDRNIIKLTNSELEYNQELVKLRSKMQVYQANFSELAFGCFELHSDDLCEFLIQAAPHATTMKKFVASKRAKTRTADLQKAIPIQNLFSAKRVDYFPSLQNKFMSPISLQTKKRSPRPNQGSGESTLLDGPPHKGTDSQPGQFNFSFEPQSDKGNQTQSTNKSGNQSTDLLGID